MTQITPDQILWPIITILVALASLSGVGIAWYGVSKRTPPIPEDLAKNYVQKPELHSAVSVLNAKIEREIGIIRACTDDSSKKLDQILSTANRNAMDTERSLGRIEGKLDEHLKEDRHAN